MKGVIFVELVNMAEVAFGEDTVDDVLRKADLANDGAFTTVGNYPCSELVKIVVAFSEHSGLSPEVLQRQFGFWMMDFFVKHYPQFFADKTNAFGLLEAVDRQIHVEVKKLYPDAKLPRFDTQRLENGHLEMIYISKNPLEAFCHGLIEACLARFDEAGEVARTPSANTPGAVRFDVALTGAGADPA